MCVTCSEDPRLWASPCHRQSPGPPAELYFKKMTKRVCTLFTGSGRGGSGPAAGAQATHFLESLTCLCLGGAHLRQTESTVGRRGMRGRTWPAGWPALPWAQARFHLEVRARTHRSGEGAGKARNEWPAPGFDPGSWSDWFGNRVITKRRPDTYPPNTHTHTLPRQPPTHPLWAVSYTGHS